MQEYHVQTKDEGTRLDVFVADKYPSFARSALRELFKNESVKLNNTVGKPGVRLRAGDKILIDASLLKRKPDKITLPVIYEDDDVAVINKPSGVLTHSKGALNLEPTVASFLRNKINDESLTGNRAGIVHRLDRGTSGLIIGAKNEKALKFLQRLFSNRKVNKVYLAVIEGKPSPSSAIIDAPIARNPKMPQTFKVSSIGKSAQTKYKVVKTYSLGGKTYSVVELRPLTGRTHQLRVHLAYIGHPIVGDPIYGSGGNAMLLHAQKLELNLPNGQFSSFSTDPPSSFKDYIAT